MIYQYQYSVCMCSHIDYAIIHSNLIVTAWQEQHQKELVLMIPYTTSLDVPLHLVINSCHKLLYKMTCTCASMLSQGCHAVHAKAITS